jgi:uncharacterized membrane protein YdjX (TVP38/TMEM64 family)
MAARGKAQKARKSRDRKLASAINQVSEFLSSRVSKVKANKSKYLRKALGLLVVALIVSAAWSSIEEFLHEDNITSLVESFGAFGPLALGLIQVLQVIVAVIPGDFLIVVAGKVYGFVGGFWLNMVSTVIACLAAFFIARWSGRTVVEKLVPAKVLDKWMKVVDEKGSVIFVVTFLVPVFPADAMNFVAGLSQISPKKFLLVSIIGRMPKIFLMTLVSSGLQLSPMTWLVIGLVLLASVLLYSVYRRKKKKKTLALAQNGKELAMNEEKDGMENEIGQNSAQKVERSELVAKAAWAALMLLVSIGLILGASAGNMALSLVWPVLLLPILSAVKALCVVVCRVAGSPTNSASAESVQGVM